MPSMLSYPHRPPSGHITCYLNRTYHVLTTVQDPAHCATRANEVDFLLQREGPPPGAYDIPRRTVMRSHHATASSLLLFVAGFLSSAQGATPHITSITQIWARQYQTIQISGSGFGSTRPYTGDSAFILVTDLTQKWSAGHTGAAVTLRLSSWSDSLLSLTGSNDPYTTRNQMLL